MIPTLLVIGIVIGILPRWWPLVGILITAAVWMLLFASDDLLHGPVDAIFVFVWGIVNISAGAFVSWLVKRLVANLAAERNDDRPGRFE